MTKLRQINSNLGTCMLDKGDAPNVIDMMQKVLIGAYTFDMIVLKIDDNGDADVAFKFNRRGKTHYYPFTAKRGSKNNSYAHLAAAASAVGLSGVPALSLLGLGAGQYHIKSNSIQRTSRLPVDDY